MVSFSKLPCEIKESIFSRIRYRDLYEVSVVCEEWFWLTMETYKGILSEDDLLIKRLLAFYNREKKPSPALKWFNLVKYANFRDVQLYFRSPRTVFETFLKSRRPIRSLCLGTQRKEYESNAYQRNLAVIRSVETKLNDILNYFPHLDLLKLQKFAIGPSFTKIPKEITKVHLSGIAVNGIAWSSLFEQPESIQSLELDVKRLIYDHCVFKNLQSLSLHLRIPLPVNEMKNILDLIRGHKRLRSVKLSGVKFSKEWFNLFGKTVENICLERIYIDDQLLIELGTDGCYERKFMSFVCSDLRTVKRFTLALMPAGFDGAFGQNEELDYRAVYTCKPHLMEEKFFMNLDSDLSREVQTITTTDALPEFWDLHIIISYRIEAKLLAKCVPASVKRLKLEIQVQNEPISFEALCEKPQNVEELEIDEWDAAKIVIFPESLTLLTNLKILEMTRVSQEQLQDLLHQCVSLEKLTLIMPEWGCFTGLGSTCVSKTIQEVNLYRSEASLGNILYLFPKLEVLRLSCILTSLSVPTAITKLKLFSVTLNEHFVHFRRSDFRDSCTRLALDMDTLDVPCKLFYFDKGLCKLYLGQSDTFLEEFKRSVGYAYCYGIPTRFLVASGVTILAQYKDFREMNLS